MGRSISPLLLLILSLILILLQTTIYRHNHRSVLATILNAIFLALMQSGISMYDLLAACTVGYVKNDLCVDLTQAEIGAGGAYLPIVVKARTEEIIFMQLDSNLSFEALQATMEKAVDGCRAIRQYLEITVKKYMLAQLQKRK
jgi:ribonuclease PH